MDSSGLQISCTNQLFLGLVSCTRRRFNAWGPQRFKPPHHQVLLRLVPTVFPMFYLSAFKLHVGVGKQLESLMRRF